MIEPGSPPASRVDIGHVARPRGVRGDLFIHVFSSPTPLRYRALVHVWLRGKPYEVEKAAPQPKGLVLKLKGVDGRDEAVLLAGAAVQVDEAQMPPPPAETYYQYQVMGMRVVTTDGRDLGVVTEILETPGNDVYVATGPSGEALLPAIADVVKSIDLERRLITIELIPGLLEKPEPEKA